MEFEIGQYVTIPSGEHLKIIAIYYCWEQFYNIPDKNRIKAACYLTLTSGRDNELIIKDYQCEYYSGMPDCAG